MRGKSILSALLLALLLLQSSAFSDTSPSSAQTLSIQRELRNMLAEVRTLRTLSDEQSKDLERWKESCAALEARLERALQDLLDSQKTVVELQEEMRNLRKDLEELRSQYSQLCKSLSRARKQRAFWMTAAAILAVVAAGEGIIIAVK